MEPRVRATIHTGITVRDLDQSIAFYRDAMGLDVTEKEPRYSTPLFQKIVGVAGAEFEVAYVKTPNHTIELLGYSKPEDRLLRSTLRACDTGCMHLAFSVDNIDALLDRMKAHGAETAAPLEIQEGMYKSVKTVYVRDPDGVILEIAEIPHGMSVGYYREN